MVELLHRKGADAQLRGRDARNELVVHVNTFNEDTEALEYALSYFFREQIDERNAQMDTPLMRAVLRNDLNATRVLLRWCGSPYARNRDGRRAIDYAKAYSPVHTLLKTLEDPALRADSPQYVWYAKPREGDDPNARENLAKEKYFDKDGYEYERDMGYYNGGSDAPNSGGRYVSSSMLAGICSCDCGVPYASTLERGGGGYAFQWRPGCKGLAHCRDGSHSSNRDNAYEELQCGGPPTNYEEYTKSRGEKRDIGARGAFGRWRKVGESGSNGLQCDADGRNEANFPEEKPWWMVASQAYSGKRQKSMLTKQMEKYFTTYYDQDRQIYVSIAGDLQDMCMSICNVVLLIVGTLASIGFCLKMPLFSWFVVMVAGVSVMTCCGPTFV